MSRFQTPAARPIEKPDTLSPNTQRPTGRGAVLAEPFPWLVIQGVILVFIIVNSQL
jgi:hypothetical protein